GLVMELRSVLTRRASPERMLYLSVVVICLAGTIAFTVLRGEILWDRNLLFGLIVLMPMAVMPVSRYLGRVGRGGWWLAIVLALSYTLISSWLTGSMETRWVTSMRPERIVRFAEWVIT